MFNRIAAFSIVCLLFAASLMAAPADSVRLEISFDQDPNIYEESDYGEAPQVAIWIEDAVTGAVRTVYVTYRTATGDFYGKVECQVSLPAWICAWRKETGRDDFPMTHKPIADAVTGATGEAGLVKTGISVPKGRKFICYLELNVAGDFNASFPFEGANGRLDDHGNGQPSLIYRAEIVAEPGQSITLSPFGRTEQHHFIEEIIPDLKGLDSALQCMKNIQAGCR